MLNIKIPNVSALWAETLNSRSFHFPFIFFSFSFHFAFISEARAGFGAPPRGDFFLARQEAKKVQYSYKSVKGDMSCAETMGRLSKPLASNRPRRAARSVNNTGGFLNPRP